MIGSLLFGYIFRPKSYTNKINFLSIENDKRRNKLNKLLKFHERIRSGNIYRNDVDKLLSQRLKRRKK